MTRSILFSVALSALLIYGVLRLQSVYEAGLNTGITRVDIYSDRIDYRTNHYPTARLFGIGLQAAKVPPDMITLHDCLRMAEFEAVLDQVRDQGYSGYDISLPDDC